MKTKSRKNKELVKNGLFIVIVFLGALTVTFTSSDKQNGKTSLPDPTEEKSNIPESSVSDVDNHEFSMEKLNEYLKEIEEPALTLSNMPEIHFPETSEQPKSNEPGNNEYLKALAEQKVQAAMEDYNLALKTKELLVLEEEEALALEDWMVDEACWCTESTIIFMARK